MHMHMHERHMGKVRTKKKPELTVPYTNNAKPKTCKTDIGKRSFSHPSARLIIQMLSVRHVSVKLRDVAETWRVTLSPK